MWCFLVYLDGDVEPVGTITGRVVDHEGENKLYIMTMGILEVRDERISGATSRLNAFLLVVPLQEDRLQGPEVHRGCGTEG